MDDDITVLDYDSRMHTTLGQIGKKKEKKALLATKPSLG
jgi:hypothetical protein